MIRKIVFTGPVGAGKSTAVRALSQGNVLSTEASPTDMTKRNKLGTTVALDYGLVTLEGGEKLHLYGTPGQERFNFMWDILIKGCNGLVLLLDNSRPNPLKDMVFFLNEFKRFAMEEKLVVGVTKIDLDKKLTIEDYRNELARMRIKSPLYRIDARCHGDIMKLLDALLLHEDHWPGLPQTGGDASFGWSGS